MVQTSTSGHARWFWKLQIYHYKGLAYLQNNFVTSLQYHKQILQHIRLDTLSHHPYDVITISPSFPPDSELGDVFTQPPAEQVLQLIYNIKNAHTRGTRSLTAIWWWCTERLQNHTRVIQYLPHLHPSSTKIYGKGLWDKKQKGNQHNLEITYKDLNNCNGTVYIMEKKHKTKMCSGQIVNSNKNRKKIRFY